MKNALGHTVRAYCPGCGYRQRVRMDGSMMAHKLWSGKACSWPLRNTP